MVGRQKLTGPHVLPWLPGGRLACRSRDLERIESVAVHRVQRALRVSGTPAATPRRTRSAALAMHCGEHAEHTPKALLAIWKAVCISTRPAVLPCCVLTLGGLMAVSQDRTHVHAPTPGAPRHVWRPLGHSPAACQGPDSRYGRNEARGRRCERDETRQVSVPTRRACP